VEGTYPVVAGAVKWAAAGVGWVAAAWRRRCPQCMSGGTRRRLCARRSASWTSESVPKELAARAVNYYVITVEGMRVPMGRPQGGARGGQQGQQADTVALTQEDLKRMQERMIQATMLVRKDREPAKPEAVRLLPGAKGPTFQFFFPKSNPIAAEEKEVKLVVKVGSMTVETKF